MPNRDSIFISHGNPEDNEIAGWLAARLAAVGYRVWIDLLHGKGHPTWEEIESEIRGRSKRVVSIVSKLGLQKPGFKDETNAAVGVARELEDTGFIIPIRLDEISFRTEVPIQLGRLNFIDGYKRGWDEVLADLLAQLDADQIPKSIIDSSVLYDTWLARRKSAAELVSRNPEPIFSNWFEVARFPTKIHFYSSDSLQSAWIAAANGLRFPNRFENRILCTFAPPDHVRMNLPLGIKVKKIAEIKTEKFLDGDIASALFPARRDAARAMVDLFRQAFSQAAAARGLHQHSLANRLCWFPKLSGVGDGRIKFNANGFSGARQLVGKYKEFYWHYAASIDLAWTPPVRMTASGHVLFSTDGENILGDVAIAAKLRRKALRSKRNAWWRDVLLAYFTHLSSGARVLQIPTGGGTAIRLSSIPMSFTSPLKLEFDADFGDVTDGPMEEEDTEDDEDDDFEDGDFPEEGEEE